MQKVAGTIALLTFIMGLTGSAVAQGQSCAAQLGSTPKVSEIIDCLKTQETELQLLRGFVANLRPGPSGAFPSGAVLAFDLPKGCPKVGWTEFTPGAGRFIIGVGGKYELPYVAGKPKYQKSGEEKVTLTIPEMPSHGHPYENKNYYWIGVKEAPQNEGFSRGSYEYTTTSAVASQGGNQPHNNLPPYIALYFCKKD